MKSRHWDVSVYTLDYFSEKSDRSLAQIKIPMSRKNPWVKMSYFNYFASIWGHLHSDYKSL